MTKVMSVSRIHSEVTNASPLKRVPRALITRTVETTCALHRCDEAYVSIVLVGDRKMRSINKEFLHHDYATDVITFALDEKTVDGEIYISTDTAARQAEEYGVSATNEIIRLVAHGVLHLLGFDDATPELRQRMHEEENRVLKRLESGKA